MTLRWNVVAVPSLLAGPKTVEAAPPKPAAEPPDYLKRLMEAKKRAKGQ